MIICPKCSASSEGKAFVGPFCVDCAPINVKVPPRETKVIRCTRCDRMRLGGKWMPFSWKDISEAVVAKCRGEFEGAEYIHREKIVLFRVAGGVEVARHYGVKIEKIVCPECSKKGGGYFEAIIQLRGQPGRVAGMERKLKGILEKKTFIAKSEGKHGGVDIYVGSTKEVLAVLHTLGKKAVITRKLHGEREGKRTYRTTFLLRL